MAIQTSTHGRFRRALHGLLAVVGLSVLAACSSSSGTPASLNTGAQALDVRPLASEAAAVQTLMAINAGGGATGIWQTDAYFTGGTAASHTNAIDVSGVINPAPVAVYQTERWGPFTYTIPGLTAGNAYTVRLHFAETYFTAVGKRQFNVSLNGTQVLTNFDIVAAGGANKAVIREFPTTASGAGNIVVAFANGAVNNAKVDGIELVGSLTPTTSMRINPGGGVTGAWIADAYFTGGNTATHANAIDMSGVINPAPLAVYQTERWGACTYTLPGLSAGTTYTVRLHFAETYLNAIGKRRFNASINGAEVLTNFDILASAGAANKAVVREFTATANGSGQIIVAFTAGSADNPKIDGIEVLLAGPPLPPTITSPSVADCAIGASFSYQILATNNPTSYGATGLPAGLTLNATTGLITGTPTTTGSYNIPLTATNAGGTGTANLALTIGFAPAPVITSPSTALGQMWIPFTYQIAATNAPTSFDATNLPAGLIINPSTGLISGTPTATSSGTVTLSATNAGGTGTAELALTITSGPTYLAARAFDPAITGPNFGVYAPDTPYALGGAIATRANAINTSAVTNPAPVAVYQTERWGNCTYTISGLAMLSPYVVRLHFAETYFTATGKRKFNAAINGTRVLTDFDIFAAAGAANKAIVKEFDSTTDATGKITIELINGSTNSAKINGIEIIAGHFPPPGITSALAAAAVINAPFQYQITTDRIPTSYSATGLPPGLSINTATGQISGVPSVLGNFSITLGATNGSGTGTAILNLSVTVGPPPVITSPLSTAAIINAPFSYQILATSNPSSYNATGLPAGLVVNTATGLITGTPTAVGDFQVALSATNMDATGTATLKLSVMQQSVKVCGQRAIIDAGEYYIQNNEWNSGSLQCITWTGGTAWSLTTANFNMPVPGAPATFPSIYKGCHWQNKPECTPNSGLPLKVNTLKSVRSTWRNVLAPGAYNVAYDLWTNSTPYSATHPNGTELMIWINAVGGAYPYGAQLGTAKIAGYTWKIFGAGMPGWKVISYLNTAGVASVENLDVLAIINDSISRGWMRSTDYLTGAEAGYEIFRGGQGLGTTFFSFDASDH